MNGMFQQNQQQGQQAQQGQQQRKSIIPEWMRIGNSNSQQQQQQQPAGVNPPANGSNQPNFQNPGQPVPNQNGQQSNINPALGFTNQQQLPGQQQQQPTESPIDIFGQIFQNTQGNQQQQQQQSQGLFDDLNQEQLNKAFTSMDFMRNVDPAQLQKLQSGDMSALGPILNGAIQQAMQQSFGMSRMLVEQGTSRAGKTWQQQVEAQISNRQIADGLGQQNKLWHNPAIAPVRDMAIQRFRAAYPGASDSQMQEAVSAYLQTVAEGFNPTKETNGQSGSGNAGLAPTQDFSFMLE